MPTPTIAHTIHADGCVTLIEQRHGFVRVITLSNADRVALLVKLELDAAERQTAYANQQISTAARNSRAQREGVS